MSTAEILAMAVQASREQAAEALAPCPECDNFSYCQQTGMCAWQEFARPAPSPAASIGANKTEGEAQGGAGIAHSPAIGEFAVQENARLRGLLRDAYCALIEHLEYFEERYDVRDGSESGEQLPNKEMSLGMETERLTQRIEGLMPELRNLTQQGEKSA